MKPWTLWTIMKKKLYNMRRYLGATWLCQYYLNVTLKVHNKTKILVSKKERPIANPYD